MPFTAAAHRCCSNALEEGGSIAITDHVHCSAGSADFALEGTTANYAPDMQVHPAHMRVRMRPDLDRAFVDMEVTVTWKCIARCPSANLNGIDFDNLRITNRDNGSELPFSYDGKIIKIHLDGLNVQPGQTFSTVVAYSVVEPIDGLYFFRPSAKNRKEPRCMMSDHETERAQYWLACVDVPRSFPTWEFSIESDLRDVVVANGTEQSVQEVDWRPFSADASSGEVSTEAGRKLKISKWSLDAPCPSYLVAVAVGDFVTVDDGDVHGIPLRYYAMRFPHISEPELQKRLLASLWRTKEIIPWLEKRFGQPFPFPKYYQLYGFIYAGAMECISLTTWASQLFCDTEEVGEEIQYAVDQVNAHEAVHSYMGDSLIISHFEEAWLKESWAAFMERQFWLDVGQDVAMSRYHWMVAQNRYFAECKHYVRPVVTRNFDSSWGMFDAHLYPGGAWRIHMLRNIVGEDLFWKAVQKYVQQRWRSTVETVDFRRALEEVSGRNLQRFFDEWIYAVGYPKLELSWKTSVLSNGSESVAVSLRQIQQDAKKNIGGFHFDLDVDIITHDNTVHRASARFDEHNHFRTTVSFTVDRQIHGEVVAVRLDPSNKVLFEVVSVADIDKKLLGSTLSHPSLSSEHDLKNQIMAVRLLCKEGSSRSASLLRSALLGKPGALHLFHWGVRVETVRAILDSAGTKPIFLKLLKNIIEEEDDRRALAQIFLLLQQTGIVDDSIFDAALSVVEAGSTKVGPVALGRAVSVIGNLSFGREDQVISVLSRFDLENDHSLIGFVSEGVVRAMGMIARDEVFDRLCHLVPPGKIHWHCRPAAVRAVASCAKLLSYKEHCVSRAKQVLVQCLKDDHVDVVQAAVSGLVTLRAREHVGLVEQLSSRIALQYQPALKRQVMKLQKDDRSNASKLENEIAELKKTVRRLEEDIQTLKTSNGKDSSSSTST